MTALLVENSITYEVHMCRAGLVLELVRERDGMEADAERMLAMQAEDIFGLKTLNRLLLSPVNAMQRLVHDRQKWKSQSSSKLVGTLQPLRLLCLHRRLLCHPSMKHCSITAADIASVIISLPAQEAAMSSQH
eukprot:1158079-Pelagomonas_calceolata.AAC.10